MLYKESYKTEYCEVSLKTKTIDNVFVVVAVVSICVPSKLALDFISPFLAYLNLILSHPIILKRVELILIINKLES